MMRVLFFFMGVPMMIMSFFEAIEVLPYATDYNLYVNGNVVEISQSERDEIQEKVEILFKNAHTLPAFAVTTDEFFHEQLQDGIFVSIKFDNVLHLNELPFDELAFKVEKDTHGFNLYRGMNGIFQGRCIYIDMMDGDMNELYDFLSGFNASEEENIQENIPNENGDETKTQNPAITDENTEQISES